MAESLYTIDEIRDYISRHKSIVATPEDVFSYWENKGWKTLKGEYVKTLSAAINVVNGLICSKQNRNSFHLKKEKYANLVAEKRKERVSPKLKPFERYKDQLSRPEWIAFRQFILVARKAECEICGSKHNLQIHHLRYIENRKAWEYLPDDIMVLCRKCHKMAHGIDE